VSCQLSQGCSCRVVPSLHGELDAGRWALGGLTPIPVLIKFSDSPLEEAVPSLDWILRCRISGETVVSCQLESVGPEPQMPAGTTAGPASQPAVSPPGLAASITGVSWKSTHPPSSPSAVPIALTWTGAKARGRTALRRNSCVGKVRHAVLFELNQRFSLQEGLVF